VRTTLDFQNFGRFATVGRQMASHPGAALDTSNRKGFRDGLRDDTGQPYTHELAQRGYVVIAPDYWPMGHYRTKEYDPYQRGYASGTMKGVWSHMRAIDVLEFSA